MNPLGDASLPPMTASDVLEQVATGVVVTDQNLALMYANDFAVALFGFPDDSAHLIGRSLVSLGLERGDAAIVQHMADQVLRGWPWEGTLASQRVDGSRVFVRAHAAPLRGPDGDPSAGSPG